MDLHATQRPFAPVDVRQIARAKNDVSEPKPYRVFRVDRNAAKLWLRDQDPIGTNRLPVLVFDECTVEHQMAVLDHGAKLLKLELGKVRRFDGDWSVRRRNDLESVATTALQRCGLGVPPAFDERWYRDRPVVVGSEPLRRPIVHGLCDGELSSARREGRSLMLVGCAARPEWSCRFAGVAEIVGAAR